MIAVKMEDYKRADGSTDWRAYEAAEVAAGERCQKCKAFIHSLFNKPQSPRLCYDCEHMGTDLEAVTHDEYVRCPKCGHEMATSDWDVYEDGTHDVTCDECDYDFEITTHVSYTFESPARIEEPVAEEAES